MRRIFIGVVLWVLLCVAFHVARAGAQVCNPVCANQPAQCCMNLQADTFLAYESDSRSTGIFRGIATDQNACAVDATLVPTVMPSAPTPFVPDFVDLPGGGVLSFLLSTIRERWVGQGAGPFAGAACFSVQTKNFTSLGNQQFTIHDGCGDHLITIQSLRFVCKTAGAAFACFDMRNVNGNNVPLPPGFDRAEQVCLVLH